MVETPGQVVLQPSTGVPVRKRSPKRYVLCFLLLAAFIFALFAGRLLVRDQPERSDVIVVLAGDSQNERYRRGMELLRNGYGNHLFLDAQSDSTYFGHSPVEYAEAFLKQDAGDMAAKVSVCPFEEDSTLTETGFVAKCLDSLHAKSVLLVTSDFHTMRAKSVFTRRLPQYRWSVAAAQDPRVFDTHWWQQREWAKTTFLEWLKVIWWNGIDRWR